MRTRTRIIDATQRSIVAGRVPDFDILTDTIDMVPGGILLNILTGQWYSLKSLVSSMVLLLECKDGAWEPLGKDDILGFV